MANSKMSSRRTSKLNLASLDSREGAQQSHQCRAELGEAALAKEKPIEANTFRNSQRSACDANALVVTSPDRVVPLATDPSHRPNLASAVLSPERPFNASMNSTRLFIASLGNPAPYQASRHSAGHVMLKALQSHLKLPPLKKSKPYANGHISMGAEAGRPEFTLWQSPSYMNISGKELVKAYRQFVKETTGLATASEVDMPGLVVLHDEMETAPGQLKARNGNLSARGHNGIKSVQQSLQSAGLMSILTETKSGGKFIKVGIGIGRPAGNTRDKQDVSAYVLSNFGSAELANLVDSTSKLVELLEEARTKMSE